jgi:hypothetical protein
MSVEHVTWSNHILGGVHVMSKRRRIGIGEDIDPGLILIYMCITGALVLCILGLVGVI